VSDLKVFEESVTGQKNIVRDYRDVIASGGDFKKITGTAALINSIRNLLLTPLGSYPFDPEYGSLLYKKIFEPADEQTRSEVEYEVKDRILQFHNKVRILSVQIDYFTNQKGFTVSLRIQKGEEEVSTKLDFDEAIVPGLE